MFWTPFPSNLILLLAQKHAWITWITIIAGYNMIIDNRMFSTGGGVALYLKSQYSSIIFCSYQDRFTSGYTEPLADRYQDYKLTGFNESNGKTFLEFHRERNTGDNNDIEIEVRLHEHIQNFFFLEHLGFIKSRIYQYSSNQERFGEFQ